MSESFKDFENKLRSVAKDSHGKIQQSRIFTIMMSHDIINDPVPILQLGMAILMNKPIGVLALDNVEIPESLRKRSFSVKRASTGDRESIHQAMKDIMKDAERLPK